MHYKFKIMGRLNKSEPDTLIGYLWAKSIPQARHLICLRNEMAKACDRLDALTFEVLEEKNTEETA